MVIYEQLEGGLVRAYSDRNVLIHGGSPEGDYAEAFDPVGLGRTYTETDIPVDAEEGLPFEEDGMDDEEMTPEEIAEALEAIL